MTRAKRRTFWLLLFFIVNLCNSAGSKKKICVIGAGIAGLTSVKLLSEKMPEVEPIAFERSTDIGGHWKYIDDTVDEYGLPVHSGIYKNMRTNGPKEITSFPDFTIIGGENRSFVKHETVFEYIKNYTDHFNLRPYIKLNTLVEEVILIQDEKWRIKTRNLKNNITEIYTCDAVMVCNGHFTKPDVPEIPGSDTFTGTIIHSHFYRRPEDFTNKTVVLLGASTSGLDIAFHLSDHAEKVYLSHRHEKMTSEFPENVIQIPGVVEINGNVLILSDGSRVKVDAFIYCTGYLYDLDFLDENTGIHVTKGKFVHPLYRQMINVDHPTMGLIGFIQNEVHFIVNYYQVQYFIALLQNKVKLPNRKIMLRGTQMRSLFPLNLSHYENDNGLTYYCDAIARDVGIEPVSEPLKKEYYMYAEDLLTNPMHFKDHDWIIHDDGHVEMIIRNITEKDLA